MAKISRPILSLLVLGGVAYAVVVLTEPDAPARKKAARTTKVAAAGEMGFTKEDYTAHFARYVKRDRDAFAPKIVPSKKSQEKADAAKGTPDGMVLEGTGGTWMLTGISTLNGVQSALIENNSTRDSVFLKTGDLWNGLRVVSVTANSIVFRNAKGKQTTLTFSETAPTPGARPGEAQPGSTPTPQATPRGGAAPVNSPRTQRERSGNPS